MKRIIQNQAMAAAIRPASRYDLRGWLSPVPKAGAVGAVTPSGTRRRSVLVPGSQWVEVERVQVNEHVYVAIYRNEADGSVHRVCTYTADGLCCVYEAVGFSLEEARKTTLKQCRIFASDKSR